MASIRKIKINALRGCPNTEIDMRSRGTIIVGDNGTGKSSIVDGLEFFFTGNLNHISRVQSVSIDSIATVGMSRSDIEMTLEIAEGGQLYVMSRKDGDDLPSNIPGCLTTYSSEAKTLGTILRRKDILAFVNNIPSERYKVLAQILGIVDFHEKLLAVQNLKRLWESKANGIREDIISQEKTLQYEFNSINVSDILKAINDLLQKEGFSSCNSLEDVLKNLSDWLEKHTGSAKKQCCVNLIREAEVEFVSTERALHQHHEKTSLVSGKLPQDYIDLLESGRSYIEKSTDDTCPHCEQVIGRDQLIQNIQTRLSNLLDLKEKYQDVQDSRVTLVNQVIKIKQKVSAAQSELESVDGISTLSSEFDSIQSESDKLIASPIDYKDISTINTKVQKLKEEIAKIAIPDPILEQEERASRILYSADKAKGILLRIDNLRLNEHKIQSILGDVTTIFETFRDQGRTVVRNIVNPLLADINGYFSFIHPLDDHDTIDIGLRPTRAASTEITMKSFGLDDTDPRAYSSEGHLDSLGLCIFLAFAKHFHQNCSLIVLDDVVSSIDANHREKIAELLITQFPDKQLLITTHDPFWAEALNRRIEAHNLRGVYNTEEILSWSKETGPLFRSYQDDWSKVHYYLIQPGEHKSAAGRTRVIVEKILKRTCENFKVPLYYVDKESKRNLNYFHTGLYNFLRDAFPNPSQDIQSILTSLENVKATVIWAHLTQHDDTLSIGVSQGDARSFIDTVKHLDEKLRCSSCALPLHKRTRVTTLECRSQRCQNPDSIS